MKTKAKGLALLLFVAMAASPLYAQTADTANQQSQQPQKEGVGEEAGYGIGAALASVFYIPAKVTYAGLGLITGGLCWAVSGGGGGANPKNYQPSRPGGQYRLPKHPQL